MKTTFLKIICIIVFYFVLSGIIESQILTKEYLPQYNLWLAGTSFNHHNRSNITDTLFYWQYVNTIYYFFITDIYFVDSLFGWATNTSGSVLRSTNSGFNWDTTQLFNGLGAVNGVHFINRDTGWAVGMESLIRKTTNGGVNWTTQDWPDPHPWSPEYFCVHFFNQETGIVTGEMFFYHNTQAGYMIRTTNGGDNWSEVYISPDTGHPSTEIHRQFWINNNTGWMCGYNILLKTTDGGLSYANYFSRIPTTQNGYNALLDLYFINENTGWICGSNLDQKNIYKTTDAGLSWVFQDNPVAFYEYPQINGIIFINADTGFASSLVGLIIVTLNGGTNWIINQTVNNETEKFAKYQQSKAWCGGSDGKIYYTNLVNPIGIISNNENVPKEFKLYQNYPNPFNPLTTIKYDLPKSGDVSIKVYDLLGKEIYSMNEFKLAGSYNFKFDGSNYASGVYFYKIEAGSYIDTKKMVLIK